MGRQSGHPKTRSDQMKKTLRELMGEYGANGVIRIDAGNGSAGPAWIDWDDEMDQALGDVVMMPANPTDRAYEDNDCNDTIRDEAQYVVSDYDSDEVWASNWIEDDNRNAPHRATNPYRYRLIF